MKKFAFLSVIAILLSVFSLILYLRSKNHSDIMSLDKISTIEQEISNLEQRISTLEHKLSMLNRKKERKRPSKYMSPKSKRKDPNKFKKPHPGKRPGMPPGMLKRRGSEKSD